MKVYLFPLLFLFMGILIFSCKTDPLFPIEILADPNNPDPTQVDNLCPEGIISFQAEVLPILVSNCAFSGCHDAISREEGVVLDSYNNIIKEVRAGKPNSSELYETIIKTNGEEAMPPSPYPRLSSSEIALVKTWIEQGAQNTICGIACDPAVSSFAGGVMPSLKRSCVGCHNDNLTSGTVNLKDYNHILPYVTNGSLLGSIQHDAGFKSMPPSGGKLNDCSISQIIKWIDEGAKNN